MRTGHIGAARPLLTGAFVTAPRQILPNATYLVTRRCAQRELLLRPSPETNAVFLYLLAVAAKRFGVRVHVFCVLSNHWHAVVTDPEASLPRFKQLLDSLIARALNASLGRREAFWAPSSYSAVRLIEPRDIVTKAAYVLANPVAAGLVRSGAEWPGLWSAPDQIGGAPLRVERPPGFFRKNGPLPESVELELVPPPGFDSASEFRDELVEALAAAEREGIADVESQGRKFLGVKRVLRQSTRSRPASVEPRGALNPRIACRDKWKRIEALGRLVEFLRSYRDAYRKLRDGVRDVVFPAGTYWLRVAHGVACEPFSSTVCG